MLKRLMIITFALFIFTVFITADYVVLKDGKVYVTDGKIRIEGDNVIFKMKGSDLEVTIPLSKVDLDKTRKANMPKQKGTTKKKKGKLLTNEDLSKATGNNVSTVYTGEEAGGGEEEESDGKLRDEMYNIPDYSFEAVASNDREWLQAEVEKAQKNFRDAVLYYRKKINEYNDVVMEFNSKEVDERSALKPKLDESMEYVKEGKRLVTTWYSAMERLLASCREAEVEEWLYKPLESTISINSEFMETLK